LDNSEQIRLLYEVGEPVGTEKEGVTGDVGERRGADVRLDVCGNPERTGDSVRVGVDCCLFWRQKAGVDEALHR
jgi:hypothetical protein